MTYFQHSRPDLGDDIGVFGFDAMKYRIVYVPISQISAASTEKKIVINNTLYSAQQLQSMSYTQVAQLFNIKN